jgi:hypothetical protein
VTALRFFPLAEFPHFGILARRDEKPVAARFLTPAKAKKLAQIARGESA